MGGCSFLEKIKWFCCEKVAWTEQKEGGWYIMESFFVLSFLICFWNGASNSGPEHMLSKMGIEKRSMGSFLGIDTKNSESVSTQSCLTLRDPMDCNSPPGSSVHGILQARILEWVAISFSGGRGSSQSRDWTRVSCIAGTHCSLSHQGSPKLVNSYILTYD